MKNLIFSMAAFVFVTQAPVNFTILSLVEPPKEYSLPDHNFDSALEHLGLDSLKPNQHLTFEQRNKLNHLIGEDIAKRDEVLFTGSVLEFTLLKTDKDEGEFYFSRLKDGVELRGPNGIRMTLARIPEGLELDKPYTRNSIMHGGLVISSVSRNLSLELPPFILNEDSYQVLQEAPWEGVSIFDFKSSFNLQSFLHYGMKPFHLKSV